ncbi:MAG: sulfite oxidase heme-binding subunit YedZ [Thermanaerothrix sp.]|uniref:sulfite oxidase heme-binding subunit YedZ n=1 Tax=Thermanaerothrix sp. TaxID=2972675 RepID=UPI003C7DC53C
MMKGLSQRTRARGWRLAAVHALGLAPLFWLGINLAWGAYWVNPLQAAIQRSGDAAILLLLASLTCTPLSWWRGWVWIGRWRRTLGLYAFGYALLHVSLYVGVDYGLNWAWLGGEFGEKPYLWYGAGAFLILLLLALSSPRWIQRWLGKTWKHLHRWVYLGALLALIHLGLVVKGDPLKLRGDVWKPLLVGVGMGVVLGARLLRVVIRKLRQG